MTHRRFSLIVTVLVSLVPLPVFAGEFDFILGDAERFEQELQWHIDAEVRALENHDFHESDSLFLPPADDAETERGTGAGLAPAQKFVTVKINGIPVTFSDVPSDTWFAPYVRSAAEANIVSGYRDDSGRLLGTFGPNDAVTVEQLAKMSLQATGVIVNDCAGVPQNSTATGSWSAHYIACAEDMGWAVYSDGAVDVKRSATRSEVVVTLVQAFDVSFQRGSGEVFDDVHASTEFSGAIEKAANDGVVAGYADASGQSTGKFGPAEPVNRAEIAKMITVARNVYGN